jgi:hypothetical protein
MSTIVTRAGKGSALTHNEVDANFVNLNNDKIEAAQTVTLTNKTISGANNTLSNIGNSSLTNSSVTIGSTNVSLGSTATTVSGLTLSSPTISGSMALTANSSSDALRVTQTGTGNALVVEDSTNPDSTPFVIDQVGKVVIGNATAPTISGVPQFQVAGVGTAASSQIGFSRWDNSSSSSAIQFAKSRSGVIGTQGIVSSDDNVGQIQFFGDDGTSFVQLATIRALVDGTPNTNDMPGRIVFSTTADGASSPTERARIDNTGNIIAHSSVTGYWQLPRGTTAERPTGASGMIRFNTTLSKYEGFSGSAWSSIGGGATGGGSDDIFIENGQTVTTNYTLTTGKNALSAGPITINSGVTVTVPSGQVWSIV